MPTGEVAVRIHRKLTEAFSPTDLEILDESRLHAGHAGARPEGETHFRVLIVADAFKGKSLIERHRMVYTVLAEELKQRVHAVAVAAHTVEDRPR